MQMLSVPEDAPDAVKAAARKLAEAVLSSQPLIKTAAAWPRMFAQTILEMRPWLAGSAASSGGAAVPDDLTAQANAVAAAVRAATRSLTVAEGRPMPSVEARGPLYRYADCDDLPPGAEIADAAVRPRCIAAAAAVAALGSRHARRIPAWVLPRSPEPAGPEQCNAASRRLPDHATTLPPAPFPQLLAPLLPVGAEAPAHFHRSGEWLAREVAAAAWWQSQEEKAIALQAEAAAAAGMVVSGGPDAAEAASAAERSDMAAASSSSSAQP